MLIPVVVITVPLRKPLSVDETISYWYTNLLHLDQLAESLHESPDQMPRDCLAKYSMQFKSVNVALRPSLR